MVEVLSAQIRTVAAGLGFLEGPLVLPDDTYAVVRGTDVLQVTDAGRVDRIAHCGGNPNGLALAPDGEILVANNGGIGRPGKVPGSVQKIARDGRITELAGGLDAPNDICVDAAGAVWFTDPRDSWFDEALRPGYVYRLDGDGEGEGDGATVVHSGLQFPNGIGFDPTGRLLVAESRTGALHTVADGSATVWGRCPYGAPDGFALTPDGWCFVCAFDAATIWLFDPLGLVAGRIDVGPDSMPTNCALRPDGALVVTEAQQGRLLIVTVERP